MRSLAGPLALLLVALAPVVVVGAVTSAGQWGRWLVRTGGVVGIVGLAVTAVATANLVVPRTCATAPVKAVNRPVLSLAVDEGDCFHSALGQVGLAGLLGVTASVAAAAFATRRDGAGAAPAVPYR